MSLPQSWDDIWEDYILEGRSVEEALHAMERARVAQNLQQPLARRLTLEEITIGAIIESMDFHEGNLPAVARELEVSLKTIYNKLNKHNLR